MTPQDFITQWGAPDGVPGPAYGLNEEQGAQSHLLGLCELPGGELIPVDIYKENMPLALMDQGQVATKNILTSTNEAKPSSTSKARVVRRSGAILKSNAYEPPACEPAAPGESPQTVAHHNASPSTSKSSSKVTAPLGLRDHAIAIAQAAKKLNDLREAWLNPPEWSHRVPEVVPLGLDQSPYPDRIEPRPGISELDFKALQKRTLTKLYNAQPAWLTLAHQQLDAAVAAAYGWADYSPALSDDEILKRLLALNLARSGGATSASPTKQAGPSLDPA